MADEPIENEELARQEAVRVKFQQWWQEAGRQRFGDFTALAKNSGAGRKSIASLAHGVRVSLRNMKRVARSNLAKITGIAEFLKQDEKIGSEASSSGNHIHIQAESTELDLDQEALAIGRGVIAAILAHKFPGDAQMAAAYLVACLEADRRPKRNRGEE